MARLLFNKDKKKARMMEWNQLSLIDGMKFSRGRWAPPHNPQQRKSKRAALPLLLIIWLFRFQRLACLAPFPSSLPFHERKESKRLNCAPRQPTTKEERGPTQTLLLVCCPAKNI